MKLFECYGSSSISERSDIYETRKGILMKEEATNDKMRASFYLKIKFWMMAVFLPQGYPESVSQDYFEYQVWDTIQAFCSSITQSLATYAVLKGSGVGDETASVLVATTIWFLRDGCGLISRILFAYFQGSSLDSNAKQWRLFADVTNDCAILLQLLAQFVPRSFFQLIMCLTGVLFSLVGIAGGSTRAALTLHQAKKNNMADVCAKDGSQETLVTLGGIAVGFITTSICSENFLVTWLLFVVFTALHIYSNYKAVKCLVIDSFNRRRLAIVARSYLYPEKFNLCPGQLLDPTQANQLESIFPSSDLTDWMDLGCSLNRFSSFPDASAQSKFILDFDKDHRCINVALNKEAKARDVISAAFESLKLYLDYSGDGGDVEEFLVAAETHGWVLHFEQLCADEYRWNEISFNKKSD